ncbi:hypothetical protein N2152v2_004172 [Parachlorella kessleri]
MGAEVGSPAGPQDLSGVWIKDKGASDSMDPVCKAMELGRLMRMAIGLVRGLEIKMDSSTFHLNMLPVTGLGWFKVREAYPMDGQPARCGRRDMRKGGHTGHLEPAVPAVPAAAAGGHTGHLEPAPDGGLLLHAQWGEPCGGSFVEHMYLASPEVLHIDSDMTVRETPVKYRTVYRRQR